MEPTTPPSAFMIFLPKYETTPTVKKLDQCSIKALNAMKGCFDMQHQTEQKIIAQARGCSRFYETQCRNDQVAKYHEFANDIEIKNSDTKEAIKKINKAIAHTKRWKAPKNGVKKKRRRYAAV